MRNNFFCLPDLPVYLPSKNMPEHNKIAAQAIKRICKSCGLVLFKKVMSKLGEAITAKGNYNKPKPFTCNDTKNDTNEN